jgi:hypothetical protein
MVTSVRWKWFLLPILGIALLAGGLVVHVEGGKPKPPPPPVLYDIQFWTAPDGEDLVQVNKMNNLGQIVGKYAVACTQEMRAFLYDPMYDQNGNPTATEAIDLNTIATAPVVDGTQMVIASAVGINDYGVIVGYLQPAGSNIFGNVRKAFVLDTMASTPTVVLLPEPESAYAWWLRINNNGDILETYLNPDSSCAACVYTWDSASSKYILLYDLGGATSSYPPCLNNQTQVALKGADGAAYRWTPPATFELIPGTGTFVGGINDSGTVCGGTYAKPPNAPKGRKAQLYPYRWNGNGSLEVLFGSPTPVGAIAINSAGDLLTYDVGKVYVYQDEHGFLDLDSLIDPGDPDAAIWLGMQILGYLDMNSRIGTTGFGQIGGVVSVPDFSSLGCLLTPRLP